MHNNVLSLRWERRKRREQDKEAKVSQARQRCRFLVSLSNSKHPTLLAPLAALGGQTKRRMFVRKVTKINKSETPPPTTWPKARGSHAAPFAPRIFFSSYAGSRRAERGGGGRWGGGEHTGGLRSSWAPPTVLPVGWLCCSGVGAKRAKRPTEQLATITTTAAPYSYFYLHLLVSKVPTVESNCFFF